MEHMIKKIQQTSLNHAFFSRYFLPNLVSLAPLQGINKQTNKPWPAAAASNSKSSQSLVVRGILRYEIQKKDECMNAECAWKKKKSCCTRNDNFFET